MVKQRKDNLKEDLRQKMAQLIAAQNKQRSERLARAINSSNLLSDAARTISNSQGNRPSITANLERMKKESVDETYFYTGMYSDRPSVYEQVQNVAKDFFS